MSDETELCVTDDEKRDDGLLSPCPRRPGRSHHHTRWISPREESPAGSIRFATTRNLDSCFTIDRTVFIEHRCEKSLHSDPSREPTGAPTDTRLPPHDPLPSGDAPNTHDALLPYCLLRREMIPQT